MVETKHSLRGILDDKTHVHIISYFTDINACASSECVRGTCSDQVNRFYCNCFARWTGTGTGTGTICNVVKEVVAEF